MTQLREMAAVVVALMVGSAAALAAAETCTSSPKSAGRVTTFEGESKAAGNGMAHTWVMLDTAGKPLSVGLTFTAGMLSGLPDALPNTEYVLPLPPEASATAFTHVVVDWNPKGHIPNEIYGVPHFDFHFYIISPQVRERMTATGADLARVLKAPPEEELPAGYITAQGAYEPHMGNHWVDAASPEFHGKPFTTTFVYGSYDGRVAFLEPMMTRAYLETKPHFSQPIKLPTKYPTHAYYPTRYALRYDAARKSYTVGLEGLTLR